ncbi:hypothetical protein FG386_001889 [Cryptosporidium ryanae]|uniref:uncharacterized protein n=1 Tax=Cryptosporidium ryanae TaxID=515981 RepID=UPI003519F31A|nr:hypothetical protein FG386_001889 [Cryptosporidium ryanae]
MHCKSEIDEYTVEDESYDEILIPGQRIRNIDTEDNSLSGICLDENDETHITLFCKEDQIGNIKTNYLIGDITFGIVNRILPRKGVEIRLLDKILKSGQKNDNDGIMGILKVQDIGCWNINNTEDKNVIYLSNLSGEKNNLSKEHMDSQMHYWMNDCFRPGDIVKCQIISLAPQIFLSTNSLSLGCVFTPCPNCLHKMAYPISYNAVLCTSCNKSMLRKTAKPEID